jgi:hypothetical protein
MMSGESLSAQELRALFISILRKSYDDQLRTGELEDRHFLTISLMQSLDFALDHVSNGGALNDWQYVTIADGPVERWASRLRRMPFTTKILTLTCLKHTDVEHAARRLRIETCLSFMAAHRSAQKFFHREFENAEQELSESGKLIIYESQMQYDEAETALHKFDPAEVEEVVSHKFCTILLNSGVHYVGKLVRTGLLRDEEAEHWVEELEESIDKVLSCDAKSHPGEINIEVTEDDLTRSEERPVVKSFRERNF